MTNDLPGEQIAQQWGAQLRHRRCQQGFTQMTFAALVGRDQGTISRYERGEGVWTPEVLVSFAVALDATVPDLFPWPDGIEDAERRRRATG